MIILGRSLQKRHSSNQGWHSDDFGLGSAAIQKQKNVDPLLYWLVYAGMGQFCRSRGWNNVGICSRNIEGEAVVLFADSHGVLLFVCLSMVRRKGRGDLGRAAQDPWLRPRARALSFRRFGRRRKWRGINALRLSETFRAVSLVENSRFFYALLLTQGAQDQPATPIEVFIIAKGGFHSALVPHEKQL